MERLKRWGRRARRLGIGWWHGDWLDKAGIAFYVAAVALGAWSLNIGALILGIPTLLVVLRYAEALYFAYGEGQAPAPAPAAPRQTLTRRSSQQPPPPQDDGRPEEPAQGWRSGVQRRRRDG